MTQFLEIREVVKEYKNVRAVDRAGFEVQKADMFGLLGPNGAGKTTIIRMITGIMLPDSGEIMLEGKKIDRRLPGLIGYLPEERGLYKKMKVGEQLLYFARLRGMDEKEARKKVGNWIERLDATGWWNRKVDELSKGMQQKVQFIATVLHDPRLLILDEPFTGLDPVNTNLIKSEIRRLNAEGTTVIFSTHRMEQVEEICERIALISNGKTVLQGEVAKLKERFKSNVYRIESKDELPELAYEGVELLEKGDRHMLVRSEDEDRIHLLLNDMISKGVRLHLFLEVLPSLNDIFIRLVTEEPEAA